MPRRGSIGRWMLVTALVGLSLAIARLWLGPRNHLREFGPMAIVAVLGLLVGVHAQGRWRRFGLGMAIAGLATSFVLSRASWNARWEVLTRVVQPIERLIPPAPPVIVPPDPDPNPGQGLAATELASLWDELSADEVYFPFSGVQAQGIIGLIELPIALAGGLIASIRWRKPKPEIESPRVDSL